MRPHPQSSPLVLGTDSMLVSVRIRARTAGGIPASRTAHDRTPGRFCLRQMSASSIVATPLPGLIPATSIVATVPWTDRSFQLTSEPMRFPPLEVIGSSPRSPLKTVHWTVFRAFRTHGACSFSDDLTSDGISATGCPQRFAPLGHRFLRSPSA